MSGRELWMHDPAVPTTTLVADIQPGYQGSNPIGFTEMDGKLYFAADDGVSGSELWVLEYLFFSNLPIVYKLDS